ncbi:MAG: hypothetical protein WD231_02630 [Candidatus Woykebacteria bacterium]
MTLQDYILLSQDSINRLFSTLGSTVTNVIAAVIALAVGLVIGYILKRIVVEISQAINFEKTISGWSVYQNLTKSQENIDLTTLIGELLRWIAVAVFLIPAVQSLQVVGPEEVLTTVLSYIPNAILAALFLILGFVVAWFTHRIVMLVAVLVGNNPARLIANIVYLAIVVFATLQALLQLGVTGEIIRLIVIAAIAASALALGLGSRDQAMELVKKFMDKVK